VEIQVQFRLKEPNELPLKLDEMNLVLADLAKNINIVALNKINI
jgi:hypothetical protein